MSVSFDDLLAGKEPYQYRRSQASNQPEEVASSLPTFEQLLAMESEQPEAQTRKELPVAAEVPVQAGLGYLKKHTWGADLFKALASASAQDELRDQAAQAAQEGRPLNMEQAQKTLQEYSKWIPTQDLAEDLIGKATGYNLKPTSTHGQIARYGSEIAGFTDRTGAFRSAGAKGGKELAKHVGQRVRQSTVAGATQLGLEKAGVPHIVAGAVGLGVGAGANAPKGTRSFTEEGKKADVIAQKHGLPQYAGVKYEIQQPGTKAALKETKLAEHQKKLVEAQQAAVEEAVRKRIPAKQAEKDGIDLVAAYETAYSNARSEAAAANELGQSIDTAPIVQAIDQRMAQIRSKRTSPSINDQAELDILGRQREAFAKIPTITVEQAMDNFHGYNSDIGAMWGRPEFRGTDIAVNEAYSFLKKQMNQGIEKAAPKAAPSWTQANKYYAQQAQLRNVEKLLGDAFGEGYNIKNLETLLRSRGGRARLTRLLGKDGFKDLQEIAQYGRLAQQRVFKQIEGKKGGWKEFLSDYGIAGLLSLHNRPIGAAIGLTKGFGHQIAKIRARALLNPEARRTYKDYLRAVATGSQKAIQKASSDFERTLEDELSLQADIQALLEE